MLDLAEEGDRLLDFGRASQLPVRGLRLALLRGRASSLDRPVELWITCRMTHVYALGHLLGRPDCDGAGRPRGGRAAWPVPRRGQRWLVGAGRSRRSRDDRQDGLRARVRRTRRRQCHRRRPPRRPRAARRGADRAARPLLGRRVRDGRRAVGRGVDDARSLSRRERQHAHRRGAARRPRTCSTTPRSASGRCGSPRASSTTRPRRTTGGSRSTSTRPGPRSSSTTPTSPRTRSGPYGATIGHWLEWARLVLHLRAGLGLGGSRVDARRRHLAVRRRRSARAGRSTVPTGSSTPSTGPAAPSYASGCTGSSPRAPPPPLPCTT